MKFNLIIIVAVVVTLLVLYQWTKISRDRELQNYLLMQNNPLLTPSKVIQTHINKDRSYLRKVFAVGAVVLIWQGIWVPTSNFNLEKRLSESQKSSYLSAYESGWADQCDALFFRLGGTNNYAYGKGMLLSYPQCMSLKLTSAATSAFNQYIGGYIRESSDYEMEEKGRSQANRDLLNQVFSISPYWCYGSECLSEADFGILRPSITR
jgi:hypothetical protein